MALNPIPPQAYTKETLQKAYSWLLTQGPEIKEMATNQEILVSLFLNTERNGAESLDRPSIQNFRTELKNLADMMGDFEASKTPVEKLKDQAASQATKESKSQLSSSNNIPRTLSTYVSESNSKLASQTNSEKSDNKDSLQISLQQLKEGFAAAYESALMDSSRSKNEGSTSANLEPKKEANSRVAFKANTSSFVNSTAASFEQPLSNATYKEEIAHAHAQAHAQAQAHTKAHIQEPTKAPTQDSSSPMTQSNESLASFFDLDDVSMNCIFEIQQNLNLSSPTEALRAIIALGYKGIKKSF